ncbi:MAG: phytanoyl-CoA dioxygenase, partial [Mycolicibacterium aromaticivorans]|nr:phytanoyl-CoA dioxygenase [Mycolicibacterium aromaticivorans]
MADVRAETQPWLTAQAYQLDELVSLTERETDLSAYPHAAEVRQNVLVYSAAEMTRADRRALQAELITALTEGPGVVMFTGAFPADVADAASAA